MSSSKCKANRGEGRLYKRTRDGKEHPADYKGGVYYLEYKSNGKRHRVRLKDQDGNPITTRTEAETARRRELEPYRLENEKERLELVKNRISEVEVQRRSCNSLALDDGWQAYVNANNRPDSGSRTLSDYKGHLRHFTDWLKACHSKCDDYGSVTSDVADQYAANLKQSGFSKNSFNKHINFLKLFYRVLMESEKLNADKNPFEKIRSLKIKNNDVHTKKELRLPDLLNLLNTAEGELRGLLLIGTFTGLRLGDACTLEWDHVHSQEGYIEKYTRKSGKNVIIKLERALATYLNETPVKRRRGYILPSFAAMYEKDPPAVTRRVKKHFESCGIQTVKDGTGRGTGRRAIVLYGFHSLRHTYVTAQAKQGVPLAITQRAVGHGSPAMTDYYTHIRSQDIQNMADTIPLMLDGEGKFVLEERGDGVEAKGSEAEVDIIDSAIGKLKSMNSRNYKTLKVELLDLLGSCRDGK